MATKTPTLTVYPFTVVIGDPDDPTGFEVVAYGRDLQQVERLFADRKWGAIGDRPITAATAAAYFAAMRQGEFGGTFDAFENAVIEVAAGDPRKVGPTERAPSPA